MTKPAPRAAAPAAPSVRQKTYTELKQLILSGRLRPTERVGESRLAEQLGVSRTPLREALMKLEKEGLVVGERNVGYTVVDVDLDAVSDLLVVREVLDAKAAEIACRTATAADLQEVLDIVAQMERLNAPGAPAVNAAHQLELGLLIHKVIARITRNEALIRVTDQIYEQLQLALLLELVWIDQENPGLAEHRAIAAALFARDPKAAARAARAHVQTGLKNMKKVQAILQRRRGAANIYPR
ncbi:MAG: GntR family transcriptional regulator [Burkholderiales bacterium]